MCRRDIHLQRHRIDERELLDRPVDIFEVLYGLSVGIERLLKQAVILIEHDDQIDIAELEESLITQITIERDPTLSHRFCRGPVGRGFIEGNPGPRPETSLQFDVTAGHAAGPLRLTAAGDHYRTSNLIERLPVARRPYARHLAVESECGAGARVSGS